MPIAPLPSTSTTNTQHGVLQKSSRSKSRRSKPQTSAVRPRLLSSSRATNHQRIQRTTNQQPKQNRGPLPSTTSRSLIRRHHTLTKNLSRALRENDTVQATQIRSLLASEGGLKRYQDASLSGQSNERGGDTGRVLVEWLKEGISGSGPSTSRSHNGASINDDTHAVRPTELADAKTSSSRRRGKIALRMLEVGALSVDSACARSGLFRWSRPSATPEQQHISSSIPPSSTVITNSSTPSAAKIDGGIERIDLHSRHPAIREIDFMDLEPPATRTTKFSNGEKIPNETNVDDEINDQLFDIVNLSLVVNFVGDPIARGNMLRKVSQFLRRPGTPFSRESSSGAADPARFNHDNDNDKGIECYERNLDGDIDEYDDEEKEDLLPALFLVLPAPCVTNSRYLDEPRLEAIMQHLGYQLVRRKMSAKLVYHLWRYDGVLTQSSPENDQNTRVGSGSPFKTVSTAEAVLGKKEEIRKGTRRNNFAIILK